MKIRGERFATAQGSGWVGLPSVTHISSKPPGRWGKRREILVKVPEMKSGDFVRTAKLSASSSERAHCGERRLHRPGGLATRRPAHFTVEFNEVVVSRKRMPGGTASEFLFTRGL